MMNKHYRRVLGEANTFLVIFCIFSFFPDSTNGDRARLNKLEYRFDRKLVNLTGGLDSKGVINLDYHLLKRVDSFYVRNLRFLFELS